MKSIVFAPTKLGEETISFARFCETPQEVNAAVEEVGPRCCMFIPLDDPFLVAELLQIGFFTKLQKTVAPRVTLDDEIRFASRSLRDAEKGTV